MKNWLARSLKNQLILFISLTVIIPVIIFGTISYASAVKVSKDRANISGESSLSQLQNAFDFMIEDVLSISVFLIGNRDVQDYMENDTSTPRQKSNIAGFLSNLAYSKDYLSNITLYPSSDNSDLSTNPLHREEDITFTRDDNKWWAYRTTEETVRGKQETITLTRPVRSLNGFHDIGYLSISLNQEYLEELLQSVDLEWNGTVLLFTDNLLLASSNSMDDTFDIGTYLANYQPSGKTVETKRIDGKRYTVFSSNIPEVDWQLVGVIPYKEFTYQNRYLLWLTVFMFIVALGLIILLSWFVVSKVLDPLVVLSRSIQKAKPGKPLSILPFTAKNEIGNLIDNYNKLNARIVYLMEQMKKNESLKRQIDLQALQHQINPHFLYNTLASIHWMALRTNEKKISEMVSSLSTYLRYSLNKGNEYTSIAQEIALLEHYTTVQHIRFPNRFTLDIDIPQAIKQEKMLKLVMQPLIENSILHGVNQLTDQKVAIQIQAFQRKTSIQFIITDNGVGMKEQLIADLMQQFIRDEQDHLVIGKNYGLRNVNLRLMMHYGKHARLFIENISTGGVMIQFRIPKGGKTDEDTDC